MEQVIVFYCAHPTAVQPYFEIARALQQNNSVKPLFLVKSRDVAAYRILTETDGFEFAIKALSDFATKPNLAQRLKRHLYRALAVIPNKFVRNFLNLIEGIEDTLQFSHAAIRETMPKMAVIPDDRRPIVTMPFLDMCQRHRVPVLLHSGAVLSSPANVQMRRLKRPDTSLNGFRATLARCLPTGARVAGDKTVCFFDLTSAFALRAFGLNPRNPWVMGGSGYVKELAVQTGFEKTEILGDPGWKPHKISVVGTPNLDKLVHQEKYQNAQTLNQETPGSGLFERPLAVFAVPQKFSDAPNFTMDELNQTVDRLVGSGFDVLLSLHPKESKDRYRSLERSSGHSIISPDPLSQVLARAQIFLASYSSTISWAGALGIPSAILDYYQENAPLYKDTPSVTVLRSPQEVANWSEGMANEDNRQKESKATKAQFAGKLNITGTAARDIAKICTKLAGMDED